MAMPRKLKLMNVFLNGYSYQGVAKSVTSDPCSGESAGISKASGGGLTGEI